MYVGTFGLRLVPAAWEIANRASEFLFIGVGAVLALSLTRLLADRASRGRRAVVATAVCIVFLGGVSLGWAPELRLAQAIHVAVGDRVIEPQGLTAARWAHRSLPGGPDTAYGADAADSRLLFLQGHKTVRTGGVNSADEAIKLPLLEDWELLLLRQRSIRYVLMDRRRRSPATSWRATPS